MAQINKPNQYFDTILYTGDGATSRTITGLNFSTDLIWYKRRSTTGSHRLIDTVRGIDKNLASDLTNAENTESTYVTAINSDGWNIGNNTDVNTNGNTMAVWNWRGSDSSPVSNTDGSITSSVSANTTAGFSIVSWTGNSGTVGHGLGVKPQVIIVKSRQTSNNWVVMHHKLTGGMDSQVLVLNSTGAESSGGAGMAEPTSSVFTITSGLASNDNQIGYVFAEKKGYSKFGSYTGNGNADGPFIYTGFKPAFVLQKRTDSTSNWQIYDNKRDPFNVPDSYLIANGSGAEGTATFFDFLSNGMKARSLSNFMNQSGGTYIYMAFAESPLVGTNNIPATAR